jgi:AcrR family transcriptional regulator
MTARGEQTREQLLDVAEQLMGTHGVERVSLREIRLAAGQRNKSAMQFHFGDRDGLLRALTDRHLPRQAAIQHALYEATLADGALGDARRLVEVLVRPNAVYVGRGASERAWIKIAADLAARTDIVWRDVVDNVPQSALAAGDALYRQLRATMPRSLALDRILSVSQAMLHVCADRARLEDAEIAGPGSVRPRIAFDQWTDNIVDMAAGAMFAPVTSSR